MIKQPFVLSGGGARGFAHIGVLKAFEECNIYPEVISATSAGAVVGALAAGGYTADESKEVTVNSKFFNLFSRTLYKSFKLSTAPLIDFLEKNLRYKTFEKLPVPLHVNATNLITGNAQAFNAGDIIPAVVAACAVPFVFSNAIINHVPYVDGGMSSNLPVEPVESYKNIIGVYVNALPEYNEHAGISESIDRMVHLLIRENVLKNIAKCSVVIEPPNLKNYRMFEEKKKQMIIDEGYNYTYNYLLHHPEILQQIT